MATIELTSRSSAGFVTRNLADDWEVTIDATGEEGPTPNHLLVANYASCFIPALRVSARQNGVDELGEVAIDVTATLDDSDDLSSISFDLSVGAALGDRAGRIVQDAKRICHVHSALREQLHADVSVTDDAF